MTLLTKHSPCMLFLLQTVTKIVYLCIGLQWSICDLVCCTGLYVNLVILLPTIIWMLRSGLFVWMRNNDYVQRIRLWRVQWLESGLRLNLYSWHTFYVNAFTEQILTFFNSDLPPRVKGGQIKIVQVLKPLNKTSLSALNTLKTATIDLSTEGNKFPF